MPKEKSFYLWGILIGVLIALLPWYMGILLAAGIVTYMVVHRDPPSAAQKGSKKETRQVEGSSCSCNCVHAEGECTGNCLKCTL